MKKVVLISMPDVAPIIIHEAAVHMPSHGIACVGGNIDPKHQVYIIDLVRKRRRICSYLSNTLKRIQPDLVGLSAMAWQFDTCTKIAKFIKDLLPDVNIVIGGYHATLMYEEIADSPASPYIDFIVRGEGEAVCRRLVNALDGQDRIDQIPALSYKTDHGWTHTPWEGPLDLARLKLPIRDKRRLTWGYHVLSAKVEVMETSRGCTRTCNYCSMKYMYGRCFRTYPIERVLADLDDIYYRKKTRWVFVADDNMVLNTKRVMQLCDAIIKRNYLGLKLTVQADCVSMAKNEAMVRKMAEAGFKVVFLGIENASDKNLEVARKGNIVSASQQAIATCQKYGMMVIGGLIFGFPDDDESDIINNYRFLKETGADAAYCQILTPYPKTGMRDKLIAQGLVTNLHDFSRYSGLWANVRTKHLDSSQLQFLFWYHRQKILGWWKPPTGHSKLKSSWSFLWTWIFKPILQAFYSMMLRKIGWQGRYQREMQRLEKMNRFPDLEGHKLRYTDN